MDKRKIIQILRDQVLIQLQEAQNAYEQTASYTQSDDLKAESKYDTRGIEAGILAGAQQKRVQELKQELELIDAIPVESHQLEVKLGSVVELEINQQRKKYFLSSTGGGTLLQLGGEPILVISVFSPLGNEIVGLRKLDEFELETATGIRKHLIKQIW